MQVHIDDIQDLHSDGYELVDCEIVAAVLFLNQRSLPFDIVSDPVGVVTCQPGQAAVYCITFFQLLCPLCTLHVLSYLMHGCTQSAVSQNPRPRKISDE
jgi:hypothetical protein